MVQVVKDPEYPDLSTKKFNLCAYIYILYIYYIYIDIGWWYVCKEDPYIMQKQSEEKDSEFRSTSPMKY